MLTGTLYRRPQLARDEISHAIRDARNERRLAFTQLLHTLDRRAKEPRREVLRNQSARLRKTMAQGQRLKLSRVEKLVSHAPIRANSADRVNYFSGVATKPKCAASTSSVRLDTSPPPAKPCTTE